MSNGNAKINFDTPAVLRKRPPINGKPARDVLWPNPYLVFDGRLGECIDEFSSKPASQRLLYEIHTTAQTDLVSDVMSSEHITRLARLREFCSVSSISRKLPRPTICRAT